MIKKTTLHRLFQLDNFFSLPKKDKIKPIKIDFPIPSSRDIFKDYTKDQMASYKNGVLQLVEKLASWAKQNHLGTTPLSTFLEKFEKIDASEINFPLYEQGVWLLAHIVTFMDCDEISQYTRITVIRNLISGLDVCAPGTLTNLNDAYFNLIADPQSVLMHIRRCIAQQVVLNCIHQKLTEDPDFIYIGNEMHYVNAVLNYYAKDLGIEFIPDELTPKDLEVFTLIELFPDGFVHTLTPWLLMEMLLERFDLVELEKNLALPKIAYFFEEKLNSYGQDDQFHFNQLVDQDALVDEIYRLKRDAIDYLWVTLLHRLSNSGYFPAIDLVMSKIEVTEKAVIYSDSSTAKLSFVYDSGKRKPLIPYLIEECFRESEANSTPYAGILVLRDNDTVNELQDELMYRIFHEENFLDKLCEASKHSIPDTFFDILNCERLQKICLSAVDETVASRSSIKARQKICAHILIRYSWQTILSSDQLMTLCENIAADEPDICVALLSNWDFYKKSKVTLAVLMRFIDLILDHSKLANDLMTPAFISRLSDDFNTFLLVTTNEKSRLYYSLIFFDDNWFMNFSAGDMQRLLITNEEIYQFLLKKYCSISDWKLFVEILRKFPDGFQHDLIKSVNEGLFFNIENIWQYNEIIYFVRDEEIFRRLYESINRLKKLPAPLIRAYELFMKRIVMPLQEKDFFVMSLYLESFFDTKRVDQMVCEYFLSPSKSYLQLSMIQFLAMHAHFSPDIHVLFRQSASGDMSPCRDEKGNIYCFRNFSADTSFFLDFLEKMIEPEKISHDNDVKVKKSKLCAEVLVKPILMLALENKDSDGLESLLTLKVNLDIPSYQCVVGEQQVSSFFYKQSWINKKKLTTPNALFRYALFQEDNIALLNKLVLAEPTFLATPLPCGQLPIEYAMSKGHPAMASYLRDIVKSKEEQHAEEAEHDCIPSFR